MRRDEVKSRIERYQSALARLAEAVDRTVDDLDKDGVIQRFEFVVELLWKALKAILTYEGIECRSPRSCIKEAFKAGIIDADETLLDMLEDRNLSSHVYDQKMSEAIFERIATLYLPYLQNLRFRF